MLTVIWQFCAGFALISDGYQNNLMTMANVLFKKVYYICLQNQIIHPVSQNTLAG